MICTTVKSDNGHREGGWIALIIGAILLLAYLLLPYHQQEVKLEKLGEQQVSIKQLDKLQLAMLNELRLAHHEIRFLHVEKTDVNATLVWPTISELQTEWLSPFMQNRQWEMLGSPQWKMLLPGVYQAISEQGSSAILDSRADVAKVWFEQVQPVTAFLSSIEQLTDLQLINHGWWLVVDNTIPNNKHEH